LVTRIFEVSGEYRSPQDFEEYLYNTLIAQRDQEKSLAISGVQVDLDELAVRRGDSPQTVDLEIRIHEIYIGTEGQLVFVAGQHVGTYEWIRLDVKDGSIRFTLLSPAKT
jgi:hypothetical protein